MFTVGDDVLFFVRLEDANGDDAAGILNNDATLSARITKQGVVGAALDLTGAGVWVEDVVAAVGRGGYWVKAKASLSYSDTVGKLILTIRYLGKTSHYFEDLRANTEKQIYDRIGAPVVTIAADLAALKVVADAIKVRSDNLPVDPADQSLLIAATDAITAAIAAVLVRVKAVLGENTVRADFAYTELDDGLATSWIFVYDTKANATTHDGVTGLQFKHKITMTYAAAQQFQKILQTLEP